MLVAQMSRMFTGMALLPPTRTMLLLWITRSSFACRCSGMLPISSRNSVPPSACSNLPAWSVWASVKAPFTWPKSSLSKSVSVMAPASTATIGFPLRRLWAWISRASMSLPVPFSPVMRTVASVGAILSTVFRMAAMGLEAPQNMRLPVAPGMTSSAIALRALSRAAVSVATSLSLSQGFTIKSNAPRFIPSTASWMSAYAVNSTTSTSGIIFLISPAQ